MSTVDFQERQCCPVNLKKGPCHPFEELTMTLIEYVHKNKYLGFLVDDQLNLNKRTSELILLITSIAIMNTKITFLRSLFKIFV